MDHLCARCVGCLSSVAQVKFNSRTNCAGKVGERRSRELPFRPVERRWPVLAKSIHLPSPAEPKQSHGADAAGFDALRLERLPQGAGLVDLVEKIADQYFGQVRAFAVEQVKLDVYIEPITLLHWTHGTYRPRRLFAAIVRKNRGRASHERGRFTFGVTRGAWVRRLHATLATLTTARWAVMNTSRRLST